MGEPDLPAIVRVSTHIYSRLLWLCPRRYRCEYGALMEQAFRDLCRDAYRQGGAGKVLRAWPRAFLDVCATAAAEHVATVRLGARELQAAGVAAVFLLVMGALVLAFGPPAQQGNRGAVALAPARAYGATEAMGDTRFREGAPRLRTSLRVWTTDPEGQAMIMGTRGSGTARFTLYTDGQAVRLGGRQPARIELETGSQVLVFYDDSP